MDLAAVVPCLADHLTLGDLVRLSEALCDRVPLTSEMRGVLSRRLSYSRTVRGAGTFASVASTIMRRTHSRCRECGVLCSRKCRVCRRCSGDPASYTALVSRADLILLYHTQTGGWTLRRSAMLRRLASVRVVTCKSTGAYLYWRREALRALHESA